MSRRRRGWRGLTVAGSPLQDVPGLLFCVGGKLDMGVGVKALPEKIFALS